MDYGIATAVAGSAIGDPRNSQELIESIYNELDIPRSKREKHYSAIAHRIRQFCQHKYAASAVTRSNRRDRSLCSTRSTTSSSLSFRTDTQLSLQSSRNSYCSSISQENLQAPLNGLANHHELFGNSARAFLVGVESSLVANPLGVLQQPRLSDHATTHCCPWCNTRIIRLHDFKRHVKDYCCGHRLWVCQNSCCTHSTYQEKQANDHRYRGGDSICRRDGWKIIDLHCDRKHFGCSYCASYFNNLDKYLHHLSKQCGPGKVESGGHQSLRIVALLQQPALRPRVEALSLELRASKHAYLRLHWCWREHYTTHIIEQLEYGPKTRVDSRNPGIAADQIDSFLRLLITPSGGSRDVVEFAREHARSSSLRKSVCKPLPSLPESDNVPSADAHQQQLQAGRRCGDRYSSEEHAFDVRSTFEALTDPSVDLSYHTEATDDIDTPLNTVHEMSSFVFDCDAPGMDISGPPRHDLAFTWEHLADTVYGDLGEGEPWGFIADPYSHIISSDISMGLAESVNGEATLISQEAMEFLELELILDPTLSR